MSDQGRRICIVGAGAVGAATALWLQRDGHEVVLVDRAPPGEGSSFGNAGCLNGSSVVPMSLPGTLSSVPRWLLDPLGPLSVRWRYLPILAPWLWRFVRAGQRDRVREIAAALRQLTEPTVPLMRELARQAGVPDLIQHQGHLYAYRSEKALDADGFSWDLRKANGVEIERLGADELRQFDPALSREFAAGLLVNENGHTSNPHRLVNALVNEVLRGGGSLIRANVDAVVPRTDGVCLGTDVGEIEADAVVVAAGAHSRALARGLGDRIPLDTERGYHLMIEGENAGPRIPTTDASGRFVVTPMEGGLRLAGTVELAGYDAQPDWRRAHMLLRQGREMLPGIAEGYPSERIKTWMGFRPSMPDSMPVIGRARRCPNVFYAFGHGHIGMTCAPMTGKVVAELVGGRPSSIDITPFRADRFRTFSTDRPTAR